MLNPYIEAWELRELIRKKELRPREAAEFFLTRIERLNPQLNAFMTVTAERALADADRLELVGDRDRAALPLFGIPYSLKDLTWTAGIRTTLGSKNFEHFVPRADQEYAVRLRKAGGILLGKTTTPEFGGRPTTEGGLCPPARNPWKLSHTAGGSSGGAAGAVAAGLGPLAEGSDGGGSIRIPSACCGLVGLKPSRGRVSSAPVMGEGWAGFATNGPITHSLRDAALMLDVMAGPAAGDPYWAQTPARSFLEAVRPPSGKLRLAAIATTALAVVEPETLAAFHSACDAFREAGHTVETIKLDPGMALREVARKLIAAGVSSIPLKDPSLVDPAVLAMWQQGRQLSAAEYVNTVARMHNTSRELVRELIPFDALLTPTLTRPAVPLGSFTNPDTFGDDLFAWAAFTFPFNATGQPALSLPNGFSRDSLPLALQIVGRPADEEGLLAIGAAFEEARPWRGQHPPLA